MQHIAGLVDRTAMLSAKQSGKSASNTRELPNARIVGRLFARMDAIFPKKWGDQFRRKDDDDAKRAVQLAMIEWGQALDGFSVEVVARAIAHCRGHCDWPPSVAEFVGFCRMAAVNQSAHRAYVPLPKPAVNRELVVGELAKMRRCCG